MVQYKWFTKNFEHQDCFTFQGKQYYTHSIVRLTEEGRKILRSRTNKVILTEQFTWWNGKTCWKYQFHKWSSGRIDAITDVPPDELIESIVIEASMEYSSIETLGALSPYYKTGKKYYKKDWEIPEVLKGWIIFAILFVVCQIFKETLFRSTILGCYLYLFWPYRQMHVNKYTFYMRDEDLPIESEKFRILTLLNYDEEKYI